MVGYFHPPPEQLLRNSECWRGLCNDLLLSSAWQSKSNHCFMMGFQDNIIGHLRLYAGREGKGWRVEKIKRGVEVWITRKACLCSVYLHEPPTLSASTMLRKALIPSALFFLSVIFPMLPSQLIPDLNAITDLKLTTTYYCQSLT